MESISNETIERLNLLLKKAFPKVIIPENVMNSGLGTFEEWDSLGNFALLMLVENEFNIVLTMEELSELNSYRKIYDRLKNG
jgi:acyl carrier protein